MMGICIEGRQNGAQGAEEKPSSADVATRAGTGAVEKAKVVKGKCALRIPANDPNAQRQIPTLLGKPGRNVVRDAHVLVQERDRIRRRQLLQPL